MATSHDAASLITDSTDWLATSLASLAPVDAALRCQVCKEFYDTPMITQCSHTFCSKCIRRCLAIEGKCPTCRGTAQENQLRSNWGMEELVNAFEKARPTTLEFARSGINTSSKKRKAEVAKVGSQEDGGPGKRMTRSSSRTSSLQKQEGEAYYNTDIYQADDSENFQPADGMVACPVCQKRMKQEAVFPHLDRCSGPPPESAQALPKEQNSPMSSRQLSKPSNSLERLAPLSYSLLKDNALKKKLSELGLSAQGSRQTLEQRHREWVTIWNANCDAAKPRRKGELLQDLNLWEKIQGVRSTSNMPGQGSEIRSKDFDRGAYSSKQNTSFQELIANARRNTPKLPVLESTNNGDQLQGAETGQELERCHSLAGEVTKTPTTPSTPQLNTENAINSADFESVNAMVNPQSQTAVIGQGLAAAADYQLPPSSQYTDSPLTARMEEKCDAFQSTEILSSQSSV